MNVGIDTALRDFPTVIQDYTLQCKEGHCVKIKLHSKQGILKKITSDNETIWEIPQEQFEYILQGIVGDKLILQPFLKKQNYILLWADSLNELMVSISQEIKRGYLPTGSVIIEKHFVNDIEVNKYSQFIILKELI
jgi:hypothetical protein